MEERESNFRLSHTTENDPQYKEIFAHIDDEVDELLKDCPFKGHMGYCHVFWGAKRDLLKSKYGIEWRTPAEMNPNIIFD